MISIQIAATVESAFDQISDYIGEEKDRGRWAAEDGYLVIDARPINPGAN